MTEALQPWDAPDPEIDEMPDQIPADLELHADIASRIIRAALKEEASAEALEDRMQADQAAWGRQIMHRRDRAAAWRESVRAWMIRTNTQKLSSPWWTAFIQKGRTKVVVDAPNLAIIALKTLGATKAIQIQEQIIKAEFDPIFQARPKVFEGAAHEETSEPTLLVRKAKE